MSCCRDGSEGAALQLLDAGASVSVVDGAGRTALHAAAEAGTVALVSPFPLAVVRASRGEDFSRMFSGAWAGNCCLCEMYSVIFV